MATIDIKLKSYDELIFEITTLNTKLFLKDKEIERLNNIINELEKWVKSEYDRFYNDEENIVFSNVEVIDFGRVLDKLKELQGSDKK